jgi:hypothetical protein
MHADWKPWRLGLLPWQWRHSYRALVPAGSVKSLGNHDIGHLDVQGQAIVEGSGSHVNTRQVTSGSCSSHAPDVTLAPSRGERAAQLASPLHGDADGPAIWLHPTTPARSLVITAQRDGGLAVLDRQGQIRHVILPTNFGGVRYNNVDLLYNFKLGSRRIPTRPSAGPLPW